jgi:ATP-dependent Clp protease ATP-binding subunit ClpA
MPNQNQMERFTQRARRVMTLAQEEATNLRHPKIEPEHFLLALLRDTDSIGGRVLIELGLGYNQLQTIIGNVQVEAFTDTPLDLSDETKRLLENAIDQSRRMGHPQVGTEHLLLGLAHGKNRAVEILAELGVSREEVERYTQRVMEEEARRIPAKSNPFSTGVRQFLEQISQEAGLQRTSNIDADRVLLLWMEQHSGAVNEVLSDMGVDAGDFWKRLRSRLQPPREG